MKARHFILEQLVPPDVFTALGDKAWDLMQPNLITTIDQLYDHFGPMTINNWHTNGRFKESGYRDPNSATGAKRSQHKLGNAADIKPLKTTPRAMYDYILANPEQFPLLTTLEDISATPTWLHVDCRVNATPGIRIVKP